MFRKDYSFSCSLLRFTVTNDCYSRKKRSKNMLKDEVNETNEIERSENVVIKEADFTGKDTNGILIEEQYTPSSIILPIAKLRKLFCKSLMRLFQRLRVRKNEYRRKKLK